MSRAGLALRVAILAALAGYLVFLLLPFYIQAVVSVKSPAEIFTRPFAWWPAEPTLKNYADVLTAGTPPFRQFLINSLIIAGSTTVVCLLLGSFAAYALARYRMPGRNTLLASLLAVSIFPQIAIISPLFLLLRSAGLLNSYTGLTLVYSAFGLPLTVWFLTAYFREIPPDLEEAARVDGCNELQVICKVLVPVAMPGFLTTGILVFIQAWNEFLFALVFNTSLDYRTATVGITMFPGLYEIPWGTLFAAATVVTLPPVLLVLIVQRRIIAGLTAGAVKG
jgi:multiple sugar transport system permease protein